MITRERLEQSAYGRGLLGLLNRLTPYNVLVWGSDSGSPDPEPNNRIEVSDTASANAISSRIRGTNRHAVVLDIDQPAWLIPSTQPNHYHLYIDVPGGVEASEYGELLSALAKVGIIEPGYAGASQARGATFVRLPWIEKECHEGFWKPHAGDPTGRRR